MKKSSQNYNPVKSPPTRSSCIIPLALAVCALKTGTAQAGLSDAGFQSDNSTDYGVGIGIIANIGGTYSPGFSAGNWTQIGAANPYNSNGGASATCNSGVWTPNLATVLGLSLFGGCNNVAYVDGCSAIANDTGSGLSANTRYNLTGYVGNTSLLGLNAFTGDVTVELLAGSTVVASETVQCPGLLNGVLGVLNPQFDLSYTTGASVPTGDLSVELEGPGLNGSLINASDLDDQVIYDDIGLGVTPVPEKQNQALAAFGLLFLGSAVGRKMILSRKNAKVA